MELYSFSITEVYNTYYNLYVAINIHTLKTVILSLQNIFKKIKKKSYKKHGYNVIRVVYLRRKDLEKERLQQRKINVLLQ